MSGRRTGRDRREPEIRRIVDWYLRNVYERHEGPGVLPFYCDPHRVGHFAVRPERLAAGEENALFRLFVALAMYQARRDVVIMKQQRAMPRGEVALVASRAKVGRLVRANFCPALRSVERFEAGCTVRKDGDEATCTRRSRQDCHVKDSALVLNRMPDLGKLPTSAWLRFRRDGGFRQHLRTVCQEAEDPRRRADLLVGRLSKIWRVGRKLATMYVSALSVPALAPGLSPWFPLVDGNDLVVVDTNVERCLDVLLGPKAPSGYQAVVRWFHEAAVAIDLRELSPGLPAYSPRLVQQAVYAFCSRSNRVARGDACVERPEACEACVPAPCPLSLLSKIARPDREAPHRKRLQRPFWGRLRAEAPLHAATGCPRPGR